MPRFLFCLPFVLVIACGGSNAGVDDPVTTPTPSPDPSSPASPATPNGPPATDPPSTTPPDPGGPRVSITMHGSTAPYAHADSYSGETPRKQIVAVKSLWLYRSASDANPVKVFDHGDKAIEVDLVGGKTVELAKVAAKSLPAGVFTMAKSGASYVKYAVDARMHSGFGAVDGYYDNVQALSEGAVIDGQKKKKGDYRYSFVANANGTTLGTLEGENAPTPVATTSGGITMDMSGPETFYVFPIQLTVDPNVTKDHVVDFELNVDRSFRWADQPSWGYTAGIYDTTPTSFEPVMAFGANSFKLTLSSK